MIEEGGMGRCLSLRRGELPPLQSVRYLSLLFRKNACFQAFLSKSHETSRVRASRSRTVSRPDLMRVASNLSSILVPLLGGSGRLRL